MNGHGQGGGGGGPGGTGHVRPPAPTQSHSEDLLDFSNKRSISFGSQGSYSSSDSLYVNPPSTTGGERESVSSSSGRGPPPRDHSAGSSVAFGGGQQEPVLYPATTMEKATCCLVDDGRRCGRLAGNASYGKRIQKTVYYKRLPLKTERSVRNLEMLLIKITKEIHLLKLTIYMDMNI